MSPPGKNKWVWLPAVGLAMLMLLPVTLGTVQQTAEPVIVENTGIRGAGELHWNGGAPEPLGHGMLPKGLSIVHFTGPVQDD